MQKVKFSAPELHADGCFKNTTYQFCGDHENGWDIYRDDQLHLQLGPGYRLVKSHYCGICSTDLARTRLPFPLPQIVGHEVVGEFEGQNVVVEINASHQGRGLHDIDCPYCQENMASQCPERLTLGIDRLPGGFAPYFLAPANCLHPIPQSLSIKAATIVEPFAAALHAVLLTAPKQGDAVAVLGPRRLGMLIIAALRAYRQQHSLDFKINAIIRHKNLHSLCLAMGADEVINNQCVDNRSLEKRFDLVFDTTGKVEGFQQALKLTRKKLHLKSTHGQAVMGIEHFTDLVINEISLLPWNGKTIYFPWPGADTDNVPKNILLSSRLNKNSIAQIQESFPSFHYRVCDLAKTKDSADQQNYHTFITNDLTEIDQLFIKQKSMSTPLIRPRGTIVLMAKEQNQADNKQQPHFKFSNIILNQHMEIYSSRCGDFKPALTMLANNPQITEIIEEKFISHSYPLAQLHQAFSTAANSRESLKVLVQTQG